MDENRSSKFSEKSLTTTSGSESSDNEDNEQSRSTSLNLPKDINAFLRPFGNEPKHIILSSPFTRRLMMTIAYQHKPSWYMEPSPLQFTTFKRLVEMADDGRRWVIPFKRFVALLNKLAPTVTDIEVAAILKHFDYDVAEELDFGEFIFVLCNNPIYDVILEEPRYDKYVNKYHFNPRQRVFFSIMAFYTKVQTVNDINRDYRGQMAPHADVLKYHMRTARQVGLNELEMEARQLQAAKLIRKYKMKFRTVYTEPVPFIYASHHGHFYKKYLERKRKLAKTLDSKKASTSLKKYKRKLWSKLALNEEEKKLLKLYLSASIPMPLIKIPADRLRLMRNKIFISDKKYIYDLKLKALTKYYETLRRASVLFGKQFLYEEMKKGLTGPEAKQIIYLIKMYMNRSLSEVSIVHPLMTSVIDRKNPKAPPPFGKSAR